MNKKLNKLVNLLNEKQKVYGDLRYLEGEESLIKYYNKNKGFFSDKLVLYPEHYARKTRLEIENDCLAKKINKLIDKIHNDKT